MPLFHLFFRKPRLRRELASLRASIEAKRAEVDAADRQCRVAWGKKWSYLQMERRKQKAAGEIEPPADRSDAQAEVFEMRRQQCLYELRTREQELAELLEKEKQLATELGEAPPASSEVHGEEC